MLHTTGTFGTTSALRITSAFRTTSAPHVCGTM
jgi:hypothetical protein